MFHHERIQAARDLIGANLGDLARDAGYSQSYVSELSNGTKPFNAQQASDLARASGLPIEFFEVEPERHERDTLQFRKMKSSNAKVTRRAKRLFHEAFRISMALGESAQLPPPNLLFEMSKEPTLTGQSIEMGALAIRSLMNLEPDQPVPSVTRELERLGVVVAPMIVGLSGDDESGLSPGHFGVSQRTERSALVGYFPGSSADRDRFTLAHELGHLVLHFERVAADPESEANLFAGAFLFPRAAAIVEGIGEHTTLNQYAQVKARYGVSIQALVMRASAIGAISEARKRSLFIQISGRGWRANEPVVVAPEYPILLRRLFDLESCFSMSDRELERTSGLPASYLRAMAPPSPSGPSAASTTR